eukprot:m.294225 g.294225  ORF g.294225 m.294225 type:complete len:665 (+) comp20028_c0_seq1:290-2284(+)
MASTPYARLGSTSSDEIGLPVVSQAPRAGRWWHIRDLDGFFRTFYLYFDAKGLHNVISKGILDHLNIIFVVFVILFLSVVVNYDQLEKHIKEKCADHERFDLMSKDCHGNTPISFYRLLKMHPIIYFILALLLVFWLWSFGAFLRHVQRCYTMQDFYLHELKVAQRDLQTVSWDEMVKKVIDAQERLQLCTKMRTFDVLDVTNLITRQRNFLIALYVQFGPELKVWMPGLGRRIVLSESLQWNIQKILSTVIFDGDSVDKRVWESPQSRAMLSAKLSTYFKVMGVLNLLLAPAVLLIRVAYFFFHNSDSLRKSAGPLAARNWSPYACWLLRDWSEVDHKFRRRLARSMKPAATYVDQFVSETTTIWARFLVFVIGGLFSVLAVLGFVFDEEFMFANLTPNRSVLWWSGILGILLAGAQSLVVDTNMILDHAELLREVRKFTHYYPDEWKGREHRVDTYDQFCRLFQFKGITFLEELCSVLVYTPYLLLFRLPQHSENIVAFFHRYTYRHAALGDFCKLAFFHDKAEGEGMMMDDVCEVFGTGGDMTRDNSGTSYAGAGTDNAERLPHASASLVDIGSSSMQDVRHSAAKLEYSVAAFREEHPSWNPTVRTDHSQMTASAASVVSLPSILEEDTGPKHAAPAPRAHMPPVGLSTPLLFSHEEEEC